MSVNYPTIRHRIPEDSSLFLFLPTVLLSFFFVFEYWLNHLFLGHSIGLSSLHFSSNALLRILAMPSLRGKISGIVISPHSIDNL
jgi:hypothetical protein